MVAETYPTCFSILKHHTIEIPLAHSISIIHVDFEPELTTFYERCGFHTGLGGIYEV
jgi:hypothetical protein